MFKSKSARISIMMNGNRNTFKPAIKNPTTCPKCKIVYTHANPISECLCCDWKNPKYNFKDNEIILSDTEPQLFDDIDVEYL